MRHRKAGRKLGRSASHRKAMFRNMVTSLIEEGMIQTTTPRAKEVRRLIEKLVTSAKRNAPSVVAQGVSETERAVLTQKRVAAIRQAGKVVRNREALKILFSEYAERYQNRNGGYTRIMKMGRRLGDNADMALIELLPADYVDARVRKAQAAAQAPVEVKDEPVVEETVVEAEDAPVVEETAVEAEDAPVVEEAAVEAEDAPVVEEKAKGEAVEADVKPEEKVEE